MNILKTASAQCHQQYLLQLNHHNHDRPGQHRQRQGQHHHHDLVENEAAEVRRKENVRYGDRCQDSHWTTLLSHCSCHIIIIER